MSVIKSLVIAFSMYSKIPMPHLELEEKDMRYVMGFFPLAGLVIGVVIYGWVYISGLLNVPDISRTLVLVVIPVLITGGIHIDGYMDTSDALNSYGDREKKLDMAKTRKMPDISLPEDLDSEEDDSKLKETKHIKELTSEQKAIFSYFIPVKGMEDQICKAYNAVLDHFNRKENASTGNLIIQGEQGCGKTMLATSFIKVLQKDGEQLTGKMGKIDAAALNKKDVQQVVRKITGGCLIIERAGDIDRSIAAQLSFLMEHDITGTLYILEDTSKGIKKALSMDEGFASKFTEKISVPIFTNDELVLFAKSYSAELGYKIDEMAILALHNRISNIERIDQATTLTEVKDIIDEAIDREAHSGLKKAISILTARRYTDDDRIVLKEDHFREK